MARKKRAWNMSNPLYRYLHGKGKKTRGESTMARRRRSSGRRFGRRSRGSGGVMSLVKPFVAGVVAGKFGNMIPYASSLPQGGKGAIGGYVVKRNLMGAVAGAAGEIIGTPLLNNVMGGSATGSTGGGY